MIKLKDIPHTAFSVVKAKMGYRIPLKITHYPTYRCNFQCKFCGRRLKKSEEMTTDEIKKCMKEFKKLGTKFWGFNGGEPLLRNDIGELITHAKNMGFKCNLATNGWLIPQKINEIKNIDLVEISIDGDKEIHNKIRGKETYERVIKTLTILKQHNIKILIDTVITNLNIDKLKNILDIVDKFDCEWNLQPVTCHRADTKKNAVQYFPTHDEIIKAVNWLMEQKRAGKHISNSKEYINQMKKNILPPELPNCWAGRLAFTLNPDGKILPCPELPSENPKYKTFHETGVKKAIESIPDMSKCRACSFSCYMEYNIALDSLTKTGFRIFKNLLMKRWFWQ